MACRSTSSPAGRRGAGAPAGAAVPRVLLVSLTPFSKLMGTPETPQRLRGQTLKRLVRASAKGRGGPPAAVQPCRLCRPHLGHSEAVMEQVCRGPLCPLLLSRRIYSGISRKELLLRYTAISVSIFCFKMYGARIIIFI